MKKHLILGLACTFMLGVSGCMEEGNSKVEIKQGSIEDVSKSDSELIQNMLSQYLWEDFDSSISEILWVQNSKENTFEQFKSYLINNSE